jgi:hypothetical protein
LCAIDWTEARIVCAFFDGSDKLRDGVCGASKEESLGDADSGKFTVFLPKVGAMRAVREKDVVENQGDSCAFTSWKKSGGGGLQSSRLPGLASQLDRTGPGVDKVPHLSFDGSKLGVSDPVKAAKAHRRLLLPSSP